MPTQERIDQWNAMEPGHRDAVASAIHVRIRETTYLINEDDQSRLFALVDRLKLLRGAMFSALLSLGYDPPAHPADILVPWADQLEAHRELVLMTLLRKIAEVEAGRVQFEEEGYEQWAGRMGHYASAFRAAVWLLSDDAMELKPSARRREIQRARAEADDAHDRYIQLISACKHVDDTGASAVSADVEIDGELQRGTCAVCNANSFQIERSAAGGYRLTLGSTP